MKPRSLILFLLPAAACTGTSAPPSPAPSAAVSVAPSPVPSPATFTFEADVVTLDPAAPSVTLRPGEVPPLKSPKASDIKKEDRTIKVEASGGASLSAIKPGDRVRVTCREIVPAVDAVAPVSPGILPTPLLPSPLLKAKVSPSPVNPTAVLLGRCESIVDIARAEGSPSPSPSR
jgi:hypothetical protein